MLSGFLITYLLLVEYEDTGSIRICHFYTRRALRIWPLYYLTLMLSIGLFPGIADLFPNLAAEAHIQGNVGLAKASWAAQLLLFIFLLPNLALILFGPVAGATQIWSIGSEEQFYLIWPLMVRMCSRNFARTLLLVILTKVLILTLAFYVGNTFGISAFVTLGKFLLTLRIELMAIGALGAFGLIHFRASMEGYLTSRSWQMLAIVLTAALMLWHSGVNYLLLGCVFAYITISVTLQGGIPLKSRVLDQLGAISYGIYMYHPLVIIVIFATADWVEITDPVLYNGYVYAGVLSVTTLISLLSFRYFEAVFQRKKARFSTIVTRTQ